MGPGQGMALGMDRPWAWMGPPGTSGWLPLTGMTLGMYRGPWALGMDGPWAGMGRGMDEPPWALGTDGLWAGMDPRYGWASMGLWDG